MLSPRRETENSPVKNEEEGFQADSAECAKAPRKLVVLREVQGRGSQSVMDQRGRARP